MLPHHFPNEGELACFEGDFQSTTPWNLNSWQIRQGFCLSSFLNILCTRASIVVPTSKVQFNDQNIWRGWIGSAFVQGKAFKPGIVFNMPRSCGNWIAIIGNEKFLRMLTEMHGIIPFQVCRSALGSSKITYNARDWHAVRNAVLRRMAHNYGWEFWSDVCGMKSFLCFGRYIWWAKTCIPAFLVCERIAIDGRETAVLFKNAHDTIIEVHTVCPLHWDFRAWSFQLAQFALLETTHIMLSDLPVL